LLFEQGIPAVKFYLCRMKFEQYHISDEIKSRLAELGFKRPTDIQFKALPLK
jgi:ATP-dependent RNA helicase RhlE